MTDSGLVIRRPATPGHWPFDPGRVTIYYGWVVLIAATVGMIASAPGQTTGVSVFTDPLTASTGLGRLELSIAYLVGTGASGVMLPRGGRLLDRYGARVIAFAATCGLAATLTGFSLVGPMPTPIAFVVLSVGFGALRFTGQGLLTLSSRTMLAQWFDRRRGIVSSISGAAVSFAFAATPALLLALIDNYGFRTTWRMMALVLVVGIGSIVVVFFRASPESTGLRIDGRGTHVDVDVDAMTGVSRAVAVTDLRFWAVTIPIVALASTSTALTFHIVDFGRELGMDKSDVVQVLVPVAMVSVPVTLLGGWLVDKISPVVIGAAMCVTQLVMYATVGQLDRTVAAVVAVAGWGMSQGCMGPMTTAALPRLFGRRHLGAIAGVQMSAMVVGSAVGPALFAVVESAAGSYRTALTVSMVLPALGLVVAVLALVRRPPVRTAV